MQLMCPACLTVNRVPRERMADGPVCGKCRVSLLQRGREAARLSGSVSAEALMNWLAQSLPAAPSGSSP